MKWTIIFVAILAACLPMRALAQEPSEALPADQASPVAVPAPSSAQPIGQPCLKLKKVTANAGAVAQGGRIGLKLQLETRECALPYQRSSSPSVVQGLVFQERSPFRVDRASTSFGKIEAPAAGAASETVRKVEYLLSVEALPEAPLGTQKLDAVVTYQAVKSDGTLSTEELPLSIPIKVVPAGTRVPPHSEYGFKHVATTVAVAIVMIPLLPLMLLGGIVQYIQHGQWPTC